MVVTAPRANLYKPHLKAELLAFIREKQAVHSADVMRAYFPAGDTAQTARYLRAMESKGLIQSTRRGKYLWWSPAGVEVTEDELAARTPKPVGRPGPRLSDEERQARLERRARKAREKRREEGTTRPPRVRKAWAHTDCTHPATQTARRKCRAGKDPMSKATLRATAKADEIAELAATEKWLTRVEARAQAVTCGYSKAPPVVANSADEPEPEGMAEIRTRQAARREKSREAIYAKWGPPTEKWDPAKFRGGPTVYQLARYIHHRMRNDRKHKGYYRFTYEWVRSHYPHLLTNYRDLVEDSLELLVIQGKIERLDVPA